MGKIERPIFIVGTGRCGSTIFHQMMAKHPNVSFLTPVMSVCPSMFRLNKLAMSLRNGPFGDTLFRRIRAGEAWTFWERCVPGFSEPYRDLRAEDVTNRMKENLHKAFERVLLASRPRLLIKLTGWTRIGFVKEVFPDAKIIHIIRDPIATANSWANIFFWFGWRGPHRWRWGPLSDEEERIWRKYDESFFVLGVIGWKRIIEAYQRSLEALSEAMRKDVIEIRYREVCDDTEATITRALEFFELEDSSGFRKSLAKHNLTNQNSKWKVDFTSEQQAKLKAAIKDLNIDSYADS